MMHVYNYLVRSSQGQRYKPPLTLPIGNLGNSKHDNCTTKHYGMHTLIKYYEEID